MSVVSTFQFVQLCYSSPRKLIHIAIENLEVGKVPKMLKGDVKKTYLPEGWLTHSLGCKNWALAQDSGQVER